MKMHDVAAIGCSYRSFGGAQQRLLLDSYAIRQTRCFHIYRTDLFRVTFFSWTALRRRQLQTTPKRL